MIIIFLLALFIGNTMQSVSEKNLRELFQSKSPFSYNFGIKIIPTRQKDASVMICCHGYGANNQIVDSVASSKVIQDHLIGFNFPDYECVNKDYDPHASSFGSINELLPLFYIMKKIIIDGHLDVLSLYGFSAGGAAVINALAVLNDSRYDTQLESIGIGLPEKKKIIQVIQNGHIILECPLKSIEEIMAFRGKSAEFEILADRYKANGTRPIDVLEKLKGIKLSILLYFQNPDDILSNRDDALFIQRLKAANDAGTTQVVIGSEGGHNVYHKSLWKEYKKFRKKN